MESFVLLILSLMTGCEASPKVKGCRDGWVDFTLKYPDTKKDYQTINIANPRKFHLQSNETNVWRTNTSLNVYHDKMNKSVRVIIKQLEQEDKGDYRFGFKPKNETITVTLEDVKVGCLEQFTQTAYETAKTTITCDYPNNYSSFVKFICKDSKIICEEILSTPSLLKSNGTFTLTNTSSGFNMSISNVNSRHAGDYWCGVKSKEGSSRASLRKIKLEIETITTFERKPIIGQDFKYWCEYKKNPHNKFICKGEDPSICQPLWSTKQPNTSTGKFSMQDDKKKKITITVRNVTTDDTGTYWCGGETNDSTRSKPFYHKFLMTVVTPQPESGSHDEESHGDSWVVIMIICIAVLLLLLLLNVILIYKRFSCLKNTTNGARAQQITEHNDYEEIPERPQMPDSGNAVETIYAMANLPTNPSASLHYSTITFKSSTDKANGEALIPKTTSSTCEYSAVSQSPIYSVIYKPSKTSEHPL